MLGSGITFSCRVPRFRGLGFGAQDLVGSLANRDQDQVTLSPVDIPHEFRGQGGYGSWV